MHVEVVGDVVAVVAQGRREERQQPDAGDAQILQVVELLDQALEIADAVVVAVVERLDVQLVDDGVFVPRGSLALPGRFTIVNSLSGEVIEVALGPEPAAQHEDTGRIRRVQLDEIPGTLPHVAVAVHDVVHLQRLIRGDPEPVEIELDPAALMVTGVETHHRHHDVGQILGRLAVADEERVVDVVETKRVVALERGVVAPRVIDPGDQLAKALRRRRGSAA